MEASRNWNVKKKNLQRRSITRRPSDKRPVDLWKKVRPFGRLTGKPSPETSPPVSEFESPNTNRTAGLLHPLLTALKAKEKEEEKIHIHRTSENATATLRIWDSPPKLILLKCVSVQTFQATFYFAICCLF